MQIDYISVFEKLKNKDILFGGNTNLALKKEIEPFINHNNINEELSYKFLLVQYEFYIYHVLKCSELLEANKCDSDILYMGYSDVELSSARNLIKRYGCDIKKKHYLYMANKWMSLVAGAICMILEGNPLNAFPNEIIDSARRRIEFAGIDCYGLIGR